MNTIDFTTVVAVDEKHLDQLRHVWPTWKAFRPEVLEHPLLLICDGVQSECHWRRQLNFVAHPDRRIVTWNMPGVSQREKMLSGLVFAVAEHVRTEWYLKIDTDSPAVALGDWLQPDWFKPDANGRRPVFVTNPWGYTRPPEFLSRLDDWADNVPELAAYGRLNLKAEPNATRIHHPRIASWCFFGNTAWTRHAADYCGRDERRRLPVPSQDTFLWYCAQRSGRFFRTVRMKQFGWANCHRRSRLVATSEKALAERE